jgi:hypothetical protein
MVVKMMIAPCRRSALWKEERLDGMDLVRRCLKTLCGPSGVFGGNLTWPLPLAGEGSDGLVIGGGVDGRSSVTGQCPCCVASSFTLPGAQSAGGWRRCGRSPVPPSCLGLPLALCQTRPKPYQTKATNQFASLATTYTHHLTRMPRARQNRIGSIVKVWSHASRHANAPKFNALSR